jgi:type IV pilus assembly protein PilZ
MSRPFVVPVRFSAGARVVQTTTLALSTGCAFVRCLIPPRAGEKVSLQLYLPDGGALKLTAKVRERGSERATGFWADFEPDLRAQARISRALASVPEKGGSERRATRRIAMRLAVRFGTVDHLRKEYTTNISAGGMFIRTEHPPAMNEVVQVSLALPGAGAPLDARAMVVHRVTPEEARQRGVDPGVGVQFVESDDRFRERIDQIIAGAAGSGG